MHYLGSKARHAAEIIAITTADRRPDQVYVEPFVGGGNVICRVPQGAGRIANDKNYAMVALLAAVGSGWLPPETMSEEEWGRLMKMGVRETDPLEQQALYAFAATGPTFGSMWAGQWARDYDGKEGTRYRQSRDAAVRDAPGLRGVVFHSGDYAALDVPEGSLVYCDPPYWGTTEYEGAKRTIAVGQASGSNIWKATPFWQWCEDLATRRGCSVYVSEYRGPPAGALRVDMPAALVAERAAYFTMPRLDPLDARVTTQMLEERRSILTSIESRMLDVKKDAAAKWQVVWSKEVVSDFSATRGSEGDENEAKTETECLFHRI